jgi:hypothetical protein
VDDETIALEEQYAAKETGSRAKRVRKDSGLSMTTEERWRAGKRVRRAKKRKKKSRNPPQETHRPEVPSLLALGTGSFETNRRGARPSRHGSLEQRLLSRNLNKPSKTPIFGCNEYRSSDVCPHCLGKVQYVRRRLEDGGWRGKKSEIVNGTVPIYRLKECTRCKIVYHRDNLAPHNDSASVNGILRGQGRPKCMTSWYVLVS